MRDIIKRINNGRRYDLDTALEIAVVTHGLPGAYSFDVERLLKKRNGEYIWFFTESCGIDRKEIDKRSMKDF